MENCGNLFFISGDNNHHHRDIWSLNTTVTTANNVSASSLYGGDGSHLHPDPHLMCLKLGKRHYFEETTHQLATTTSSGVSPKRRKPYYALGGGGGGGSSASAVVGSSGTTAVPRCQVEGCHVALVNAKDYHRRHKVCEMHSKAPKVIVVGLEQRFCQQCSRFHVLSEFDETKRSCRRRLAGHNERRRKSSHDSASKNTASQGKLIMGRFQYLTSPTESCALSLLSSKSDSNWISSSSPHHDISSRSSAALRELIAEHRATFLARQLILDRNFHHHHHHHTIEDLPDHHHQSHPSVNATSNSLITPHQHLTFAETSDWDRINDSACSHLTLDLMQAPNSAFGFLPTRGKNNEEEGDECSELRNSLEGTYVV